MNQSPGEWPGFLESNSNDRQVPLPRDQWLTMVAGNPALPHQANICQQRNETIPDSPKQQRKSRRDISLLMFQHFFCTGSRMAWGIF